MKRADEKISGVILAGGSGRRFGGRTKHNIMVGGKTIISRMLGVMEDIFDEILIVTSASSPDEFEGRIIHDEFSGIGPLGGIHAAIKQSAGKAVFVFAGDMPLISRDIILQQIELFRTTKPGILVPRYGNLTEPLHSIYNNSILPQLESFITNNKNHPVYELFRSVDAAYFDLDDTDETRNYFLNINTPGDVILAEKILTNLF